MPTMEQLQEESRKGDWRTDCRYIRGLHDLLQVKLAKDLWHAHTSRIKEERAGETRRMLRMTEGT